MVESVQDLTHVLVHLAGLGNTAPFVSTLMLSTYIKRERMLLCIAICTTRCANGGTCSAPYTCTCSSGWTGQDCTTRKYFNITVAAIRQNNDIYTAICTTRCANGGLCSAPNRCTCSFGWTGQVCTTRKFFCLCFISWRQHYSCLYYSLC